MKRLAIVLAIVALFVATNGCASTTSVPRVFPKLGEVYQVNEDAKPTMDEMERRLTVLNKDEEPEEMYVISLYIKADKNGNGRVTKKEAEKALEKWWDQTKIVLGAIPFKFPEPEK